MCEFISLILPANADSAALGVVLEAHGRTLRPQDNASLQQRIGGDWRAFLTCRGQCDCGTALGAGHAAPGKDVDPEKEAARLRKRGWKENRIARALAQRAEHAQWAQQQTAQRDHLLDMHRVDAGHWLAALQAIFASGVPRLGLMVRSYDGTTSAAMDLPADDEMSGSSLDVERLIDLQPGMIHWIRR